jgi:hypothetical protein
MIPGVLMRDRKFPLFLCLPLIAVLTIGCTGDSSPSDPSAKANQKAEPAKILPKGVKAPKKPKELKNMTGPSQLVE